jgi:hypothetical protein
MRQPAAPRAAIPLLCLLALCAVGMSARAQGPVQPGAEWPPGEDIDAVEPEEGADTDGADIDTPAIESSSGIEDDWYLPDLGLEEMPDIAPETLPPAPPPETAAGPAAEAGTTVLATPFHLLGVEIFGGQRMELKWTAGQSFGGRSLDTPVLLAHGLKRGPVLCLTAAVHGDELNGVEIVRRVLGELDPQELSGTVIGVPIVNLMGFLRGSRYLPDRRDLNRYFPGNPRGSAASRIAYLFFRQIVRNCDYLVDFHTGSLDRTNLPQLRADLSDPRVYEFTQYFGATSVLHHHGATGTLRRVASESGIPTVTFELGEPRTLQPEHVDFGVLAIDTLIGKLGMLNRSRLWAEKQPVFYASRWVRSDQGGILITNVKLGAKVREGDVLGTVTNPLSNEVMQVRSPFGGRVLGMALNQFVLPGFAAFHVGIATKEPDELMKAEVESGTTPPAQDVAPDALDAEAAPDVEEGAGEQPEYD